MGLTRAAITHPPRRGADGTMTLTQPWTVRRDGSRDTLSRGAIRRQRAGRGRHPDLNPTLDGDGADGAQDTHGALQIWTTTASFCPQGQNGAVVNAFDSTFRHHGFDSYGLTHGKKMAAEIRCEDSERSQLTNPNPNPNPNLKLAEGISAT